MERPTSLKLTAAAAERGMAVTALAGLIAPGIHAIAKSLGASMSAGQMACARLFFQALLLLPLAWAARQGHIPPPTLTQIVRGALLAATALFFFWALAFLPLADTAAIFYVEPLVLVLIAALFLGEPVGWRRLLAVAVGFLGVLLIIRPSFEAVGPPALLPLLAAASYAGYLAITRHATNTEHPRVMQLWVCVSGALVLGSVMALASPLAWPVLAFSLPTATQLLLLLAMGAIATTSHMLAIHAIRMAPAQILAPFQYTEILGATILGIVIFANWPDAQTWLGIAIIVGAGLYVFFRERQLARRRSAPSA